MNNTARALCEHLVSRNNDIGGYWGIGQLCSFGIKENRDRFSFKIHPGKPIRIWGSELGGSIQVTSALTKYAVDSIEGRITFIQDGRYDDGSMRYTCTVAIAITQDRRTGMYLSHVRCWPHDYSKELKSTRRPDSDKKTGSPSIMVRLNNILNRPK